MVHEKVRRTMLKLMKMNWKKRINLNSYEWWRNHRRVVTLGIFLALFSGYVRGPSEKDIKIKDICLLYNLTK